MNAMIRWLVDHATTVTIAVVCVFLFGTGSYITLPRESSPDITIPVVIVSTPYIGVSPEDVENLITIPMEIELASLKNTKTLTSTSAEGVSVVAVEFEPETVIEDALQRVRDRVSRVRPSLPADVEESSIREISFSDVPVVLITMAGNLDEEALKQLAEELQEDIGRIEGVLDVKLSGGKERAIRIQVNPGRLAHYGLSLRDIANAISDENVNIPGGNVEIGRGNVLLRVPGEFGDPMEIESVAIKRVGDSPVFVRDVARVVDGYKDRETYARMAGQPSVTLAVTKRAGSNILEVASTAKEITAEHAERWPQGVTWRALGDESKYIAQSVSDLQNNIITALILVVGVIVFVMGVRPSLFVAISIPLSMLASMLVLQALGFTLNMMVLFSLILALGMLVDNAIVVVENVYRHKLMGKDRRRAAIEGTQEVATAVAASTLTTVAAFLPLVFWGGIMGEFMGFLPKTVIIVLVMSLIMALCVLPVAMSRMMPTRIGAQASGEELELRNADLGWIMSGYRSVLRAAIRFRYVSAGLGVAALLGTFGLYAVLNHGTEFFPETEPDRAILGVRLPQGTDVETTDRVVRRIEKLLSAEDNLDTWVAEVGVSAGGDALSGTTASPNEARVTLDFLPDHNSANRGERSRQELSSLTVDRLRTLVADIPGAKVTIEPAGMGPPVGKPINVEVSGEDFDEVGLVAQRLRRKLSEIPGVTDLEDDYKVGRPELRMRIDRGAAKRVGVSTAAVGDAVRTAIAGTVATTLRDGEDEYDIVVELAPEYRENLQSVLALRLPGREDTSPDTFPVPLSSVATYDFIGGSGAIKHIDQDLVVTVAGDVLKDFNANDVRAEVEAVLADFDLPGGMHTSLTGENEEQAESMIFLGRAFLIAVALITLVLVTQFDSFAVPMIVVATVVLSLIGVLWGLVITVTPFGVIMTGIGVISLAGVVVNNAIVLLDYVQQLIERGLSVTDALVEAGLTRFRPVMLTAITTALGLVPMALGVSIDFIRLRLITGSTSAQWWGPMAVAVIFGLSFATVLTLVMVPTLFSIYDDLRRLPAWLRRPDAAQRPTVGSPDGVGPRGIGATSVVLLGLWGLAVPAPAAAVTLDEAWASAEQNNLQLALATEQAFQVSTNKGKAWSALSPRLTGTAAYIINNQQIEFSFDPSEFLGSGTLPFEVEPTDPTVIQEKTFWQADVTLTQRLFSGTALPGIRAAQNLSRAADADLRDTRIDIKSAVAGVYYGVLTAERAEGVAARGVEVTEAQRELAERQVDAGLADRRALIQASLAVSRAQRDLESARERVVDARTQFELVTGLTPSELQVPEPMAVPDDREGAISLARDRRPDLQAAELRSKSLRQQRTAQDLRWMPVVDGVGSYNFTENAGFNDQNWTWRVLLQAQWELWDGGLRIAERRETASQMRAAELTERLIARQAEAEIEVAFETYRRADAAMAAVQTELELASENLRLAEASYGAGSLTWIELEQAKLALQATELTQLQERMTRDLAALDLMASTGAL